MFKELDGGLVSTKSTPCALKLQRFILVVPVVPSEIATHFGKPSWTDPNHVLSCTSHNILIPWLVLQCVLPNFP